MVKQILKYCYWLLFCILLFFVGIKYFTPKPKPVTTADMPAVTTYNKHNKTYSNSNYGTYHYLGYTTNEGTFYAKQNNTNKRIIIIKFKFKNDTNQPIKPFVDLQSVLKIEQGKRQLKTGNLQLNNKNTALISQVNNAVKIYHPHQEAKIALPYVYRINGQTVKIYLGNHLLSKFN